MYSTADYTPQRIVCLSTETVEVLYALGQQHRIVGISGYTVRPPQARQEKPKVFAFSSGDLQKILAVEPDLVLSFSNLQAQVAHDLIKSGVEVLAFNQQSVADIYAMIDRLGRLCGAEAAAQALMRRLDAQIKSTDATFATILARAGRKPRVYFEEWDEPMISGLRWVSEIIGLAGGDDCFAAEALHHEAGRRIVGDPLEVVRRAPDIIIGSWCGKHFRPERVAGRAGWNTVPAVRDGEIHEIKSALILTPGPVAIEEALPALNRIVLDWAHRHPAP
ncbi:MAG TPA: ABC transporter substrate-binding protein [Rhodocyclaceae bacterium]|nr:ABC transporter substrate-binding protein [Rhodocyclaceae bacterium]